MVSPTYFGSISKFCQEFPATSCGSLALVPTCQFPYLENFHHNPIFSHRINHNSIFSHLHRNPIFSHYHQHILEVFQNFVRSFLQPLVGHWHLSQLVNLHIWRIFNITLSFLIEINHNPISSHLYHNHIFSHYHEHILEVLQNSVRSLLQPLVGHWHFSQLINLHIWRIFTITLSFLIELTIILSFLIFTITLFFLIEWQ